MPTFLSRPTLVLALGLLLLSSACGGKNPPAVSTDAGPAFAARDGAQDAAAGIDTLLVGRTPSAPTQNFFLLYDALAHRFSRNPDCVAASIDTTCLSVNNSANADGSPGTRGCVTMVTPLHGLTNHHFGQPYATGVIHYFVDLENTVYARTVVRAEQIGDTDIEVVTFDSPLPAAIRPAQVFPGGATARLLPAGTPLLSTNQKKQVVITELAGAGANVLVRPAEAPGRRAWTASPPAVLGDSDSPTFAVLGGRPLLLFTYYGNTDGPAISEHIPAINRLLGGSGYTLNVAVFD